MLSSWGTCHGCLRIIQCINEAVMYICFLRLKREYMVRIPVKLSIADQSEIDNVRFKYAGRRIEQFIELEMHAVT